MIAAMRSQGTSLKFCRSAGVMLRPSCTTSTPCGKAGPSGRLVTSSPSVSEAPSAYRKGDRVFHQKFGPGDVAAVEGNKLTVDFDKAGRKRVIDSFVTRG